MFSIYLITNTITHKKYIGYTNNVERRWANHKSNGQSGKGGCSRLYAAIKKYGLDNFVFTVIHSNIQSRAEAKELEIKYILEHSSFIDGYNGTPGGTGGDDPRLIPGWSESIAKYHSEKPKESYATCGMLGKTHSEDTKQKQRVARKQHWESMTCQQLKDRSFKISGKKNGMFGKTPKNSVKIELYGIIYNSITEACTNTGHSAKFVKKHGKIL